MNTVFLLITLIIIAILGVIFAGRTIISPVFLFITPMIFALADGLIYYQRWRYNLSPLTIFIIVSGCIAFTLGCVFVHTLVTYKYGNYKIVKLVPITIPKYVYLFAMLLMLVNAVVVLMGEKRFVAQYGYPSGTVAEVIGSYNDLTKFGDLGVSLGGFPAVLYEINFGITLTLSFLAAHGIADNDNERGASWTSTIAYIEGTLLLLVCGSRSVSITVIISFLTILILLKKKNGTLQLMKIKIRTIFIALVALIMSGFIFLTSLDLIGRSSTGANSTRLYDISIYLGAPFKNLDIAIAEGRSYPAYFGENTFKPLYATLDKLGLDFPIKHVASSTTFQSINGVPLGNVYTIFNPLYNDFGALGTVVILFIAAVILQILFEKAMYRVPDNKIAILDIVYGFFAYQILFSFFANMVFASISTVFLKKLCVVILICWLYNITLRNRDNHLKSSTECL